MLIVTGMTMHRENHTEQDLNDGDSIEDEESEPGFIIIRRDRSKDPDPRLLGNSMAMALPPPCTDTVIVETFSVPVIERPSNFRSLSLPERFEYISRLSHFHYTFQAHIDFIHKVIAVVRYSYVSRDARNPLVIAHIWRIIDGIPGQLNRLSGVGGGGGLGILVIGPTGVGKSCLIDRIVAYLRPMARIHLSLAGRPARWMQLGVVKIKVMGTWKLTLLEILGEVDRQVQMDYYLMRARDPSIGMLQQHVWGALTSHFCPLLILDEFQTLGQLSSKNALDILNGLIHLMEKAGIPVMLVGNEAVRSVLEQYRNQLEKFSNEGISEFEPLLSEDPAVEEVHEDAYALIETFKTLFVSIREPVYEVDFNQNFIAHTMGVARVMREYFKVIFRKHAKEEAEGKELFIDKVLLESIARKEMRMFEPAMDVLRKRLLGFAISLEDWKVYEEYLPPEPLQTPAKKELYMDWMRADNNVQREMPAGEYRVMHKRLTAMSGGSEQTVLQAFIEAAPIVEISAKQSKLTEVIASKVATPKSANRPSSLSKNTSKIVKGLVKKKVKSLTAVRKQKTGDGPPTLSAEDLE